MTIEEKRYLKELLSKLPRTFWEDEDHAVGGYISKKDLFELLSHFEESEECNCLCHKSDFYRDPVDDKCCQQPEQLRKEE